MATVALPRPLASRRLRSASDERLVALVRDGDEPAFEVLFDRHLPAMLSFCRHMLGSREEAEDAVQHTFLSAHRSLRSSDRPIALKPWLYAIARNRCLSVLRSRKDEVALDDEHTVLPATAGLATDVERREDLRAMLGDLRELPEAQRAALLLSELGAHSHDEIAEVLDVRRDKVKALVFQARESLASSRMARETPCAEIREELATAKGAALRRGPLRRHLASCAGCRSFRDEVTRQRAAIAIVLPVIPTAGLKASIFGGLFGGGGGAAAAGAGGAAGAAGVSAGSGGVGFATGGLATKIVAAVAVVGTAGTGGYVAVHERGDGRPGSGPRNEQPVTGQPASATGAATPTPAPASTTTTTSRASGAAKKPGAKKPGEKADGAHRGKSPPRPRRTDTRSGAARSTTTPSSSPSPRAVAPTATPSPTGNGQPSKRAKGKYKAPKVVKAPKVKAPKMKPAPAPQPAPASAPSDDDDDDERGRGNKGDDDRR